MSATLYGHPLSPPSQLAKAVATYLNVPFEWVEVDVIGGAQFEENYKKLNPNSKVPTWVEGDFSLAESAAIARYLASKDGGSSIYPADVKERAEIDKHTSILNDLRFH